MNAITRISELRRFEGMDTASLYSFCEPVIESVKHGHHDPLEIWALCKTLEDISKVIKSGIEEDLLHEVDNHDERFTMYGYHIEKATTGTKYDFTGCNDSQWTSLKNEADAIAKEKRDREKFLKSLKGSIADTETGDIINPPKKQSKSSFKLTRKK